MRARVAAALFAGVAGCGHDWDGLRASIDDGGSSASGPGGSSGSGSAGGTSGGGSGGDAGNGSSGASGDSGTSGAGGSSGAGGARPTATGTYVAHVPFGMASPLSLAVGGSSVFVGGAYSGQSTIPDWSPPPADDVDGAGFVVEYTLGLVWTWGSAISATGGQGVDRVASNTDGALALTCSFQGSISLSKPIIATGTGQDTCFGLTNSNGTRTFIASEGFADVGQLRVALANDGDVVVAGSPTPAVNLGDGVLAPAGASDIVIARFGPTGQVRWTRRYGGVGAEIVKGVGVDGQGNVYVGGDFIGDFEVGGVGSFSSVDSDVFVLRLGADGTPLDARQFGGAGEDACTAMAVNSRGSIALIGRYADTIDFGGPALQPGGTERHFAAELDSTLSHSFSTRCIGSGFLQDAAIDEWGSVVMVGTAHASLDCAGETVSPPTPMQPRAIVVKLSPTGTFDWGRVTNAPTMGLVAHAFSVATAATGDVYVGMHACDGCEIAGQTLALADPVGNVLLHLAP